MLLEICLAAAAVVVVALLVWAVLRATGDDETERFRRAREITSQWSDGVAREGAAYGTAVHGDIDAAVEAAARGEVDSTH